MCPRPRQGRAKVEVSLCLYADQVRGLEERAAAGVLGESKSAVARRLLDEAMRAS